MRRNKFGNTRVEFEGEWFDSKAELIRWCDLRLLQRGGHISDLKRQVPFVLSVNGVVIGKYIADFTYLEKGESVSEDVKGVFTPLSKWKIKHCEAQYGIKVKITRRAKR